MFNVSDAFDAFCVVNGYGEGTDSTAGGRDPRLTEPVEICHASDLPWVPCVGWMGEIIASCVRTNVQMHKCKIRPYGAYSWSLFVISFGSLTARRVERRLGGIACRLTTKKSSGLGPFTLTVDGGS